MVTAEAAEYTGQAERLRGPGCDHFQGYLISRPVPADALVAMARTQAAGSASWSPLFQAMAGGLARSVPQVA